MSLLPQNCETNRPSVLPSTAEWKHFVERSDFAERSQEHQGNIRCGFNSDSSYKNWEQIAKAFVCQCWVELQHQGNTMRGLTSACVPVQTEKRIARALFARRCGVELQHQRECSFKSIGFHQYTSPWRRVVFLFLRQLLVSINKHPSILARAVHKQWSSWNLCSRMIKKVAFTEFNT